MALAMRNEYNFIGTPLCVYAKGKIIHAKPCGFLMVLCARGEEYMLLHSIGLLPGASAAV